MAKASFPDVDTIRQLVLADYDSGRLFWLPRDVRWFNGVNDDCRIGYCQAWNRKYSGKECFLQNRNGYRGGGILGFSMQAHRLIWAHKYGYWPDFDIDHINRVKHDNRLANLRPADDSKNQANIPGKTGTSQYKGVCYHSQNRRWMASIRIGGRSKHLGYYDDEVSAAIAYDNAAKSVHGDYAYLNFC